MVKRKASRRRATSAGVTMETLELLPERAFRFLLGVARNPAARRALERHGFDAAERRRGIALLDRVLVFRPDDEEDAVVAGAGDELDQSDERILEHVRLALTRFPAVRDRLLQGIAAGTGAEAVRAVDTLLGRLDELERSRAEDEAMAHLAARGLGPEQRRRLRSLVETARSLGQAEEGVTDGGSDGDYEALLVELRDWFEEWTGFAKLAIDRRDLLMRLGLADLKRDPGPPKPGSDGEPG
jgi:hypothetical protein